MTMTSIFIFGQFMTRIKKVFLDYYRDTVIYQVNYVMISHRYAHVPFSSLHHAAC